MNKTEQKKVAEDPVISPLANEKTYGERVYTRVFDWGLNYWANLLASAGFSQWASNSTKEIKIFGFDKAAPRVLQEKLGDWISKLSLMNGYKERQIAKHGLEDGMKFVSKRGFAMAESLTLLVPGFAVMIPSVWLGAKIKPMFVEWFNKRHYGDDAMEDPSLKARHQAIRAEEQPTLLGTVVARLGTVGAVQLSAKLIGSESNTINWIGEKSNIASLKKFNGINPAAETIGVGLGNSLPASIKQTLNAKASKWGLSWSNQQMKIGKTGTYDQTAQDLSKYIAMDTMYTAVSAGTIRPFLKLLRHIPGMSHKPKVAANSPTFDGEKVKVPTNRYADTVPLDAQPEPVALSKAVPIESPSNKISHITQHNTVAANDERHVIHA